MVKVKICGITSLLDAEKSLEFGADMLGFNFYAPSPRAIAAEKAREIIAALAARVVQRRVVCQRGQRKCHASDRPRGKVGGRTASLQRRCNFTAKRARIIAAAGT